MSAEESGSIGTQSDASAGTQSDTSAPGITPAPSAPTGAEASIIGGEAAAAPVAVNYVGADGSFVPDWTSKLGEEFAPAKESLSRYKNVGDLAKAYVNAEKAISKKGVIIPTADSPAEEVAAYRKAMGVPETPVAYAEAVKPNVILPEGVTWDDGIAQHFFEIAHKHNVPAAAMQELAQMDIQRQRAQAEAVVASIQEKKQEGIMQLRQSWGANFDKNLAVARRAAATAGIDANSYGFRDIEVVKGFVRLASMISENRLIDSGQGMPAGTSDYLAKAKDIVNNRDNPDYKKYHDGDAEVQARVRKYFILGTSGK
jgi:hypothetical protein